MTSTYALIKNDKVLNIIVADNDFLQSLINDNVIDFSVELTEENFYSQINKAEIGSHYEDGSFIPKSWIKNSDGIFVAPIEKPNDGCVYEWQECYENWIQLTPYPSWSWDEELRMTTPPVPMPGLPEDADYKYIWNESDLSWVQVPAE